MTATLIGAAVLCSAFGSPLAVAAPRPPTPVPTPVEPARPSWRVAPAVRSPAWLDFGATHRTRYEYLADQFRAGAPGRDMGLALRTTVWATVHPQSFVAGAELADSRMYLGDDNTPLDTGLINPIEVLQAYAGADVVGPTGSRAELRVGRITMDVGSRRFVARNRFRNTINTFTGFDFAWTSPTGDVVRAFGVIPVDRRPSARDDLAAHRIELDREASGTIFWGLHYGSRPFEADLRFESYAFGLHEWDSAAAATRNRRLLTPGLRLLRPAAPRRLDLEVEGAVQPGVSRASDDDDDTEDLAHFAVFGHTSIGYTIGVRTDPRFVLQYDYASGDADPTDRQQGRFDTLFGARRFELGPTSLFGAIARSNVNTPGARFEIQPHRTVEAHLGYRAVWLAQARDAWTASGVRDDTGASGTFVGQLLEVRARWHVLPENIDLEAGFAHLVPARFATTAPNGGGDRGPTYVYGQVAFQI